MLKKKKVLLIAEACNPTFTSVPLVGYNFAKALADRPDLEITLVSHIRNRAALESDSISQLVSLVFIDNEFLAKPLYKLSKLIRSEGLSWTIATAMSWPSYICFEYIIFRKFKDKFRAKDFDLIHRLTPLTPTIGSPLARWIDTPMVLGPLNGGLPWPKHYPELRVQEREWLVPFRNAYKFLPFFRSTYKRVSAVISGSFHTESEIPAYFKGKKFFLPENGIDPARFKLDREWLAPIAKFRFVTVGRLVPYKGMDMIVEAISGSDILKTCEMTIFGEGPQRARLEDLIKNMRLTSVIHIAGWKSQAELSNELRESHAFVFPSLREFGGGVVLEAMASGLPSIIADYGGPAELVDEGCAVLIPMVPREQFVLKLRSAMEELVKSPERCKLMSQNAISRIKSEYIWTEKAKKIGQIYDAIL